MSMLASNKNTSPQQTNNVILRRKSSNELAGIQQEHKATTTKVIKIKMASNGQAVIQQGHKATATNVIKKRCIQ